MLGTPVDVDLKFKYTMLKMLESLNILIYLNILYHLQIVDMQMIPFYAYDLYHFVIFSVN